MKTLNKLKIISLITILGGCDIIGTRDEPLVFEDCSDLRVERMVAADTQSAESFDYLLNSYYKVPIFEPNRSYHSMLEMLENSKNPFGIRVDCIEENILHVSFDTKGDAIKGFYILRNQKYWSGPFSDVKINAVIQANPDLIEMLNKKQKLDSDRNNRDF